MHLRNTREKTGETVRAGSSGQGEVSVPDGSSVPVHDKAHIRLVDAHAHGDGRADDGGLAGLPRAQRLPPRAARHARVVEAR